MRLVRIVLLAAVVIPVWGVETQPVIPALAHVRRIYVDQLGGGRNSDQLQDMIVAALQNTGLFTITENRDNADAVLKGSGDQKSYTETHSTSDSIGVRASASSSSGAAERYARTSSRQSGSAGVTESESSRIDELRTEASASVRLVAADGDVIWSTTQESRGAKFKGAMADVADKVARKLADETSQARAVAKQALPLPPSGQ